MKLTRLAADERFPDSTFVEDTAVMMRALPHPQAPSSGASATHAILTRPGASSRAGEVESIAETLSRFGAALHSIKEPGTLDGGDVCEAGDHFFIGVSERTNDAGAGQLAQVLASSGYTSSFVDIRAVNSLLHLKSGLAWLGDNRLAVIDALADHKAFRGYDLVRVNAREQYAANCVRANEHVLVAAGFPEFEGTLQSLGYKTLSIEMTEFQKMDGGLSCLSLRF
jgi:dimethylargininase